MKNMLALKTNYKLIMVVALLCVGLSSDTIAAKVGATSFGALPETDKKIRIALLLDTSNSMDGLIDQAKAQLWEIVNELAKAKCEGDRPDLEIALYEYGNDNLPSQEGYIRMVLPLTSDLDDISEKLFALKTHGGNEYCGQVINTSINQLNWGGSSEDLKMIFIAGNEPFTQGRSINYTDACLKARDKNIVVNTIFCGRHEEGIATSWKAGADLARGSYMSIEQNKKTVYIDSPYDDDIARLNNKLNKTYVAYGALGKEKKEKQRTQDSNAQSYGSANAAKRAISKSSRLYKNESWDLVDASEDKDFEIDEIREEELPQEMKGMSTTEKKRYVEKKKKERDEINAKIQELSKKRQAYVREKQKASGVEMLDKAMLTAIRKQAANKNFTFE
ncbi:MAG: vWA domain-containing protein [Bacteroidota bacterium]